MASTASGCTNPTAIESGKLPSYPHNKRSESIKLAAQVARAIGMVPTWPNVQTIRLAIESEAEYSAITIQQASTLIVQAAAELTDFPRLSDFTRKPTCVEENQAVKANIVDRFWFEDARWRMKPGYWQWLEKLREGAA